MAADWGVPEVGATALWAALAAALLTGAHALLAWAFAVSDLTVANVLENSRAAKPLLLRLAGSWASHEGSLVLWCMLTAWALWALARGFAPSAQPGLGRWRRWRSCSRAS